MQTCLGLEKYKFWEELLGLYRDATIHPFECSVSTNAHFNYVVKFIRIIVEYPHLRYVCNC